MGVTDYRIVESLGATEGTPASGTAELIVDITTTGATLEANGLRILDDGVILKSEANLVASSVAAWGPGRSRRPPRDRDPPRSLSIAVNRSCPRRTPATVAPLIRNRCRDRG